MSEPLRSPLVRQEALGQFCSALLLAARLPEPDAVLVSKSLVEASLRGTDSHGVARLPHYLNRITHGSINPRPALTFEVLGDSCGRVDGDDALGQLVMWRAALESISLARKTGAGWISVRNSTHCGALDFFGRKIAEEGMIGMVFTHVDSMVLPFGSREPFCGTNPICIAAPAAGGYSLCLDMATSAVSWNEVANAAMEKLSIPPGVGVDASGRETIHASAVQALYPAGGYKGSGLGLMVDVLCAMLSGAPYGPDIPKMYGDPSQRRQLGGLVGAIDISRFASLEVFARRVAELLDRWNALTPDQPGGKVLYPGQRELLVRAERLRHGIPIPATLLAVFDELARKYRVRKLLLTNLEER